MRRLRFAPGPFFRPDIRRRIQNGSRKQRPNQCEANFHRRLEFIKDNVSLHNGQIASHFTPSADKTQHRHEKSPRDDRLRPCIIRIVPPKRRTPCGPPVRTSTVPQRTGRPGSSTTNSQVRLCCDERTKLTVPQHTGRPGSFAANGQGRQSRRAGTVYGIRTEGRSRSIAVRRDLHTPFRPVRRRAHGRAPVLSSRLSVSYFSERRKSCPAAPFPRHERAVRPSVRTAPDKPHEKKELSNKSRESEITPVGIHSDRGEIVGIRFVRQFHRVRKPQRIFPGLITERRLQMRCAKIIRLKKGARITLIAGQPHATIVRPDYPRNESRIPAATAEPTTPATLGPIACMSR